MIEPTNFNAIRDAIVRRMNGHTISRADLPAFRTFIGMLNRCTAEECGIAEEVQTPDALRDALDHIMRFARQGISPTKRLDWIEIRARYALEGKQWSPDIRETPRDSVKKMERDFAKCREELAALSERGTTP